MPPRRSKRSAGASDLPNTAQVKIDDVKKLFMEQKGYLDNFFEKVGKGEGILIDLDATHPGKNKITPSRF